MRNKAFCKRCLGPIDYKEEWVAIQDEYLWFYHARCYREAAKDGHMPEPDYKHGKGKPDVNPPE